MRSTHKYTNEQRKFILDNYIGVGTQELTNRFNTEFGTDITLLMMKSYKANHKLNSGLTGQFSKGHSPINKGTKGMFNVGGNRTSFKPGQLPSITDPIGTEKVLKDGYVWVKINNVPKAKKNVNWKQKQRIVWEEVNGEVPTGYFVIFADGNIRNFDIDNLVLATKAEILYLNRHHMIYKDADFTKSAVLVARLQTRVDSIKRKQKGDR